MKVRLLAKLALVLSIAAVFVVVSSDQTASADTDANAERMLSEGKQTFRFDTFGDEAFWSDALQLHRAIEGAQFGGVGPGVSPVTALAVGLKVDSEALPQTLISQLKRGRVNLEDPATTLALLKLTQSLV
jgi:precorrin-2 methylase